jgi:DNA helicase-2/ATP-dependent DNA helicase PcrA
MNSLNNAQQQAVTHVKGPLLIVAGAGTGKTTVIARKIEYLVNEKLARPEEILALSFNEKAADEIHERVDAILQTGYTDMHIATFHAFCQTLLQEFALDIGLPNQFRVLKETEAWLFMREHFEEFALTYYRPLGNPTRHIHEFLNHFSSCKDELITPEAYLAHAESLSLDADKNIDDEKTKALEIANAYHKYQKILVDAGVMDFGDLLFYAVKLLKERKGVREKIQARYKYILVDEFQDVNHAQYELVKLLTGANTQLTVVGDDDQSIYAFRGASVSNILRFKDDFPEATEVVLTENYRSGQAILDMAYTVIQNNNPDRLEVKLNLNKKLLAKGKVQTGEVIHLKRERLEDEVSAVVEELTRLKTSGDIESWDEAAILVRANAHAEPFVEALERARIPFEFLSSVGLYRQPIVLDCLNFFKILGQYDDPIAMFRLLRLPPLGLSENDFQKIIAHEARKKISLYEAAKRATEFSVSNDGITALNTLINAIHAGLKNVRHGKPTEVLYQFLDASGYLAYLTKEELNGNAAVIRQIHHLATFFKELEGFEASVADAHVSHFLERYKYIIDAGDEGDTEQIEETPDSVQILTVHKSKGLEFGIVFMVNMVEERFPTRRRGEAMPLPDALITEALPGGDEHMEEERRLFYVAATRAKEKLYFVSSTDYGGAREKKPSRFLVEAGLVEEAPKKKRAPKGATKLAKVERKDTPQPQPAMLHAPGTFSFSQLETYGACPYRYKLKHVLRIPTPGKGSFSFGSSMHCTFQKFYERVQELNGAKQESLFGAVAEPVAKETGVRVPTLDELLKIYETEWKGDWYDSAKVRDEYFVKGKEILKLFYTANDGRWTVPIVLEGAFTIMVGNHRIRGRIDRIDQLPDNTLEIIDYKTGQSKEMLSSDDKPQLLIYHIAATTLPQYRGYGPVGKLTFYYVNDGIRTSFATEGEELEKLKEKLLRTMDRIHEGDFTATPSPHVCKWCDYKDICEFRVL